MPKLRSASGIVGGGEGEETGKDPMKWFLIASMLTMEPAASMLSRAIYGGGHRDARVISSHHTFDTEADCLAEAQKGGGFHTSDNTIQEFAVMCVPGYIVRR